jgi:hypothetical protein
VNLYFLQGISRKLKRGIKMSQGIKLNNYKNYYRRLQRTSGGNPRGRALEATRWDWLAPPWCHPTPGSGPACQLLECSSIASLDYIYVVLQVGLIQGLMLDSA